MQKKSVVVKKSCHSRKFLSGIFHVLICYVHKAKNLYKQPVRRRSPITDLGDDTLFITAHGFTLIELLVVVLIIGILAAIALPQYKLAVEKSRATEIITQLKALAVAEQAYFLANGEYTNIPENLDLSFQDTVLGNKSITQDKVTFGFSRLTNDPPYIYGVLTDDSHADNNHQFFLNYVLTTGEIYCEVHDTATDLMKKVCKSFGSEAPCPKNNGTAATCHKVY